MKLKLFCKHSQLPKIANYLRRIAPLQVFDWALNIPRNEKSFSNLKQKIKAKMSEIKTNIKRKLSNVAYANSIQNMKIIRRL